jgi:deoxyribonuclease-4
MKIGIKIWSTNEELFPEVKEAFDKELIDYVEMYYIPGSDPDISLLKDIPMIVHTPHFKHGFNIGKDSSDNMRLFLETKTFVEKVGALYQIIHPGFGGSEENVIAFLKKIRHAYGKEGSKRIMIENMPYKSLEGTACHGHTVEQMERYLKIGPFSFCFDLAHACKASISLRTPYKTYVKDFFRLKPASAHLSGCDLECEKDQHLNLWETEMELRHFLPSFGDKLMVAVETPKSNDGTIGGDLKNIAHLKSL